MVTEDLPAPQVGGLGKHVVTLANHLIRCGHEVDILGRSDRDYASVRDEVGFNGRFIEGFTMSRNGWKETQLGVFMPPKRPALARRIAQSVVAHSAGYQVIHYHGHLPMLGRYLPASLPFVQTRHDQGSECVTHLRYREGGVCSATDPRECAKCIHPAPGLLRTMVSAHAVRRYRKEVAETFSQRPTIFVSDFLRRNFVRAVPGGQLSKAVVLHNFIDLDALREISDGVGEIQVGKVFLAGRIDEAKGFREFLRCANKFLPGSFSVEIAGDGPDRSKLQDIYACDYINFLGWRSYSEVIRRTATAHVCVVPSMWEEPFGATVIEALALGRPCFALRKGGIPELHVYQRYPGQLQLFDSMVEMVESLSRIDSIPVCKMSFPAFFGADVSSISGDLIRFYKEAMNVS